MPSKKHRLLARVNFPLYTVQSLSERHVLVAGGGGGAKTGIPNVIEIYELFNDGSTFKAESVAHFETGSEAIMNSALHRTERYSMLYAGMDGNCRIYKIQQEVVNDDELIDKTLPSDKRSKVRHRKTVGKVTEVDQSTDSISTNHIGEQPADINANIQSRIKFCIKSLDFFQTDFSPDPFQKLTRFSRTNGTLLTAGSDGHIRAWKSPHLNKILEIDAHSDDVDDLDICPLGKKIVSCSRDGHAKVWDLVDGSLLKELEYSLPFKFDVKYSFRSCRFGIVDDKDDLVVFASINPIARSKTATKSYICKWDTKNYSLQKMASAGTERLSAMAISDNGRYLSVGTQEGTVKIFIAFSLQNVYHVRHVHGIFVTGLEFMPTCEETQRLSGGHEASLISISVDNHVIVHHIPTRASMGILTLMTILILTLLGVFVLMDYLNL